jgi:hypothetical protein
MEQASEDRAGKHGQDRTGEGGAAQDSTSRIVGYILLNLQVRVALGLAFSAVKEQGRESLVG